MKEGKLEKELCNRIDIMWCIDYFEKGCPKTCNYAKRIETYRYITKDEKGGYKNE